MTKNDVTFLFSKETFTTQSLGLLGGCDLVVGVVALVISRVFGSGPKAAGRTILSRVEIEKRSTVLSPLWPPYLPMESNHGQDDLPWTELFVNQQST